MNRTSPAAAYDWRPGGAALSTALSVVLLSPVGQAGQPPETSHAVLRQPRGWSQYRRGTVRAGIVGRRPKIKERGEALGRVVA